MASVFDAEERRLRDTADGVLPALATARRCTEVLSEMLQGTTVPRVEPGSEPPRFWVRAATLQLAARRACCVVVSSGYWPEAHGLKRRLSEVHVRAQAVAEDTSGQYARQWLEGRPPKVGPTMSRFGSDDLWALYSWSRMPTRAASTHSL